MFATLQHRLLLRRPLIWNTRIVPVTVILLILNALFFIWGFASGYVTFSDTDDYFSFGIYPVVFFLSFVLGLLVLVIWLVFYLKNNSFKAFYPRKPFSLFFEWALVFWACFLLCCMPVSFFFAEGFRKRCYYSEEELARRLKVIEQASFFYDGAFQDRNIKTFDSTKGVWKVTQVSDFRYRERRYSVNSLFNKLANNSDGTPELAMNPLDTISPVGDTTSTHKMREWLYTGQRDSVRQLLTRFLRIADEHKLSHSVSAEQWLRLVYHAPDFPYPVRIRKEMREEYYPGMIEDVTEAQDTSAIAVEAPAHTQFPIDTMSQEIREVNGKSYIYNKYFVPAKALENSYEELSKSYRDKYEVFNWLIVVFYIASVLSLAIFSYRVSTGRNWLIALVVTGVSGITLGLFASLIGSGYGFLTMWLLLLIVFNTYFALIWREGKKKWSGVALNIVLWQLPGVFFICYTLALELVKQLYGYYASDDRIHDFPTLSVMDDQPILFYVHYGNMVLVIATVALLSPIIRRWKGIPED